MTEEKNLNFIEALIEADLQSGKHTSIVTRFPPEPNGYLHLGHAKSICLNFGLALKYGGKTNLRFDDTNPVTEEEEYVESIKNDVCWLGFQWSQELYTSDYFKTLYTYAHRLIDKGLAYVDDNGSEAIAAQKGTPTQPGVESEYRQRSVEENRHLFTAMREGKYPDGARVLRAKIDMQHTNMLMRDPVIYRIKHAKHHRTGNAWCIYPMYDFAHGQSDAIEKITHSICTLEFVLHRDLYDWFIEKLDLYPSKQYEFARLNMTHTVMSKRKLLQMVNARIVDGWDDPRMPTLSGARRRGYTPEAIRDFCDRIGIAKRDNLIDVGLLEFCVREHLNKIATRRMVTLYPLKVVITNYTQSEEWLTAEENNLESDAPTTRKLPFGKELWIEQEDFMEHPPKNYFRLTPGQKVRLKHAYIIQCDAVIKDSEGNIRELCCSYIPESKSGQDTSGISVKGVIHWVSAEHAIPCRIRLYDRLFTTEEMNSVDDDFTSHLNPNSLQIIEQAWAEPALASATPQDRFQFLRMGYFIRDSKPAEKLTFNRTVTLRDTRKKGK